MVSLVRTSSSDEGTFGYLQAGDYRCFTGELPWRDNRRKVSCIPEGEYEVAIVKSPKFGEVYGVRGVPGRDNILIHRGNFSGDVSKGCASHVEGCILLGRKLGRLQNPAGKLQHAVLVSIPAVNGLMDVLDRQPFRLVITNRYAEQPQGEQ